MLFGTSPQYRPYLGGQLPIQGQQQLHPLLQQLLQNPSFLARLQQPQGGLGAIGSPYGHIGIQPIASSAYSLR